MAGITRVPSTDEQLGSPVWTLEAGWLIGLLVGLVGITVVGRQRRGSGRRVVRGAPSHD